MYHAGRYFAQGLAERGITHPIGIADTAIGGQRIEEFMNNGSYAGRTACPDEEGGQEVNCHPRMLRGGVMREFVKRSICADVS